MIFPIIELSTQLKTKLKDSHLSIMASFAQLIKSENVTSVREADSPALYQTIRSLCSCGDQLCPGFSTHFSGLEHLAVKSIDGPSFER